MDDSSIKNKIKSPLFWMGLLVEAALLLLVFAAVNQPRVTIDCVNNSISSNIFGDTYTLDFVNKTAFNLNFTRNNEVSTVERIKYGLYIGKFREA